MIFFVTIAGADAVAAVEEVSTHSPEINKKPLEMLSIGSDERK